MVEKDIRWIQWYSNFSKALGQLSKFVADAIADAVFNTYYAEFTQLEKTFQTLTYKDD